MEDEENTSADDPSRNSSGESKVWFFKMFLSEKDHFPIKNPDINSLCNWLKSLDIFFLITN